MCGTNIEANMCMMLLHLMRQSGSRCKGPVPALTSDVLHTLASSWSLGFPV